MRDKQLKACDRALDPHRALKLMKQTGSCAGMDLLRVREVEVVKHRPGRRMVVRYVVEAGAVGARPVVQTLYGKLYRGRRGERTYRRMRYLESLRIPAVRFPRPLGYSPRRRFLLIGSLDGCSMTEMLWSGEAHLHVGLLGRSLAAFHSAGTAAGDLTGDVLTVHDGQSEAAVLDDAARRVDSSSLPRAVTVSFRSLQAVVREGLIARTPTIPESSQALIHRDLHPDQIRLLEGQIGLLDLDEAARGEAELDVGNFVAHLILEDLQAFGVVGQAPFLARCFLDAYRGVRPLEGVRVGQYTAAALLRLASLRRVGRSAVSVLSWDCLAGALLAEARAIVNDEWVPGEDQLTEGRKTIVVRR